MALGTAGEREDRKRIRRRVLKVVSKVQERCCFRHKKSRINVNVSLPLFLVPNTTYFLPSFDFLFLTKSNLNVVHSTTGLRGGVIKVTKGRLWTTRDSIGNSHEDH